MTTSGDTPQEGSAEHLPAASTPEEAMVTLLTNLATEPTPENFAAAQAILNQKVEAAQTDVAAFRFVIKYLREKSTDAGIRAVERRDYGGEHIKSPYDYPTEYETTYQLTLLPVKERLAQFILRKAPSPPRTRTVTRIASVLNDFSPLRVELPENWNDLVTKYLELPSHREMQVPYRSSSEAPTDTPTDDWEILKQAKVEFARRLQAQDIGGSTDFYWWGYQSGIDEQAGIVEALNEKMGLSYKDGFLVPTSK